ncbi:pentatricopeptide repeat-containing At1g74400 [Olea europaea subsp. europaea]|uniref:Pentatricopeptide repeat-containing At1g74400 n=2 Tax=Olea europaea subsp. europaea TaxID=158383 RepID=A0A8S0QAG4_OLEEU|nr:pentatricopeptide repeat-containing At1g74400 [Olea europaea subsp. europaea]
MNTEQFGNHVFHLIIQMIRIMKCVFSRKQPRIHFHTHLRKERPNQTLKNYLKSNPTKTLLLFKELLTTKPFVIDSYSLLYATKACIQKSLVREGMQFHNLVIKLGYQSIIVLQTSLIGVYSSVGNLDDAHHVFEEIPTKNVVCWTALIAACVNNQDSKNALQMFRKMQRDNVEPDQVNLTVALSACVNLGALEMGEWIHAYIRRKRELKADLSLNNALINMYTKCGDIRTAKQMFESMKIKDVTTWTSMIVGHAIHGQAHEALQTFAAMEEENKKPIAKKYGYLIVPKPNDVTFIGVLMACSHTGLVEEGKRYIKSMVEDYGLKPRNSHFGCMVDIFCRCGLLSEAYEFILAMPIKPNAVIWRTLLGACAIHGYVELASVTYYKLLELEESLVGDDIVMSNIYSAKGMWDKKLIVRKGIKQRRAPGCSSIELGDCIHEFVSADDDHSMANEFYIVLHHLVENMRTYSYDLELSSLF